MSSTAHTSHHTTHQQEQDQPTNISRLQRNELKARLNNMISEAQTMLRLLARDDVPVTRDAFENLLIRQSQLLDTALNPK